MWKIDGPQGNEAAKIKYDIVPFTRGRGLDLGCGLYKAYSHFIGVDSNKQWGRGADIVNDCAKLDLFSDKSMNFVFSSHLLEHIEDYAAALKEWWRVIKPGGYLVLYLPHKDFYPNIGKEGTNPDHKHDFVPQNIINAMPDGFDLLVNEERNEGIEYSFFQVFHKRNDKQRLESWKKKKPLKTACVVRYGGFGDMIQASSVLPGLKKQGYHVTFNTTPNGYEIMKHDPHVDAFLVQDKDQVPNAELTQFWKIQAAKFDKFINLSESVEGTFLSLPGRTAHTWPKAVRDKMLNFNYMEHVHLLADVPLPCQPRFFASQEEKRWAESETRKMGGRVVLWCLAGSSLHKTWPYLDNMIASLLLADPTIKIVLTGDHLCKILEQGWEKEERVIKKSGEWSIRETLAFAEACDLVIGPETGVLNAVSDLDMPKVVFLSHSSEENLTKYWKNTSALTPVDCECYPCHMMHYSADFCDFNHEMGVAQCQLNISPEVAWEAIEGALCQHRAA